MWIIGALKKPEVVGSLAEGQWYLGGKVSECAGQGCKDRH